MGTKVTRRNGRTAGPSSDVIALEAWAFRRAKMPGIIIPLSITAIKQGCFERAQCDTITFQVPDPGPEAQKPKKLELGCYCFRQATIREIAIPLWVKVLPRGCFKECARLVKVTVRGDAQLKKIEMHAFAGTPLTGFAIPAAVSTIDGSAFAVNICENRGFELTVDPGNKLFRVEGRWLVESGVKIVRYFGWSAPDSVLKIPLKYSVIGARSFAEVRSLGTIEFGQRVAPLVIEEFAFWKANLPEIVLPLNIETIRIGAFNYTTRVRVEKGGEEKVESSEWNKCRWKKEKQDVDGLYQAPVPPGRTHSDPR
jgi:hypothetical protein